MELKESKIMFEKFKNHNLLLNGLLKNGNKHCSEKIFKTTHKLIQKQTKKQVKLLLKNTVLKAFHPFKIKVKTKRIKKKKESHAQPVFLKNARERVYIAWMNTIFEAASTKRGGEPFVQALSNVLKSTLYKKKGLSSSPKVKTNTALLSNKKAVLKYK